MDLNYATFTALCTMVQSAVLRSHVVCLSVTLVDWIVITYSVSKKNPP